MNRPGLAAKGISYINATTLLFLDLYFRYYYIKYSEETTARKEPKNPKACLNLETSRSSSTSGSLELSTVRKDSWGLVLVRTEAEVSDSLSGVSWASDDDGVLTLRSSDSQLVQGDSLTTSLDDSSLGRGGESQSSDGGLRDVQQSDVVGDGTNNDDGLVSSTLLLQGRVDSGKRHRRSVDLGQEQRSQDDLVERSVGTT